MRTYTIIMLIATAFFAPVRAADNTFLDYQNYNHGYCPQCNGYPCSCPSKPYQSCPQDVEDCPDAPVYNDNIQPCYKGQDCGLCEDPVEETELCADECPPPCDPCAPVCGTTSGFSIAAVGLALIAIGAGAVVIVTSNNGSSSSHS